MPEERLTAEFDADSILELTPELVGPSIAHGRWAFAEFTEVYQIEADFAAKVEAAFGKMIEAQMQIQCQAY